MLDLRQGLGQRAGSPDCVQRRRVELEDEDFKQKIPERMDAAAGSGLAPEIRALIEHMAREKDGGGG